MISKRQVNRHVRWTAAAAAALTLLLFGAIALASPGFQYKLDKKVQAEKGHPSMTLKATGSIEEGTITFERSDGKSFTKSIGSMTAGQTQSFTLEQPEGTFHYDVEIEATGGGQTMTKNVEFDATRAPGIELSVNPDEARIGKGKIPIRSNRPIDRFEYEVYDSNGVRVDSGTQHIGGKRGTLLLRFEPNEDVAGISVVAHDVDGFWRSIELEPFWVNIPHQEVIFEFGKATWEDSEEPKLEASLKEVREVMKKHRDKGLQMRLYISGYTDTVGSKSENMKLSTARAKAIARWFENNGLDIPIYYQGFGESVLAVETPDETKEPKNRRVIYTLGNAQPPLSGAIPKANWRRVR